MSNSNPIRCIACDFSSCSRFTLKREVETVKTPVKRQHYICDLFENEVAFPLSVVCFSHWFSHFVRQIMTSEPEAEVGAGDAVPSTAVEAVNSSAVEAVNSPELPLPHPKRRGVLHPEATTDLRPASQHFSQDQNRQSSQSSQNALVVKEDDEADQRPPPGLGDVLDAMDDDTSKRVSRTLVDRILGNKLDAGTTKSFLRNTRDLYSRIRSIQSNNKHKERVESELKLLRLGRVPDTVRKCPFSFEVSLLDTVKIDREIDIGGSKIKKDSTIRDAKNGVWCQHARIQRELDLLLLEKRRSELRDLTKFSSFLCVNMDAWRSQQHSFNHLDLDFEDITIAKAGASESFVKEKIELLYYQTLAKAAEDKTKQDEDDKRRCKSRSDMVDALVKSNPQDLFEKAIDERISKAFTTQKAAKGKGKGKPSSSSEVHKEVYEVDKSAIFLQACQGKLSVDVVEKHVQDKTKNGVSPATSRGKIQPTTLGASDSTSRGGGQKAKSKGKGKNKQNRGKGRGAQPSKSKGKGKTKSDKPQQAKSRGRGRGAGSFGRKGGIGKGGKK